jgi:hypothetical protein
MRSLLLIILYFTFSINSFSQSEKYTGTWEGILHVGSDLRIVFHIKQTENGNLRSTADSPDQYAFGIKCDSTFLNNNSITIIMNSLGASFTGMLSNDSVITGNFVQQAEFPLTIKKKNSSTSELQGRPLTPEPPFPNNQEENRQADNIGRKPVRPVPGIKRL